jgi:hypothetical protein
VSAPRNRRGLIITIYTVGLMCGTSAVLNYFHDLAAAHRNNPHDNDYYLQMKIDFTISLVLIGVVCTLLAPFLSTLKLHWKAAFSLVGVGAYALLLKAVAIVRIATAGVP